MYLRQDFQLAREHGNVLVLVPLALLQLFPISGELVKEMIDYVCLEDLYTHRVGQLLCVFFNFHVESQNCCVSI